MDIYYNMFIANIFNYTCVPHCSQYKYVMYLTCKFKCMYENVRMHVTSMFMGLYFQHTMASPTAPSSATRWLGQEKEEYESIIFLTFVVFLELLKNIYIFHGNYDISMSCHVCCLRISKSGIKKVYT